MFVLEKVLEIKNLTKIYGNIYAVNNLSLSIPKGSVFGILGPNGSGKTTTLGIILDVVNANNGTYRWFGNENNTESRKSIGAILETPCFYPYLTAVQNLKIVADIKNVDYDKIEIVLQQVGLLERKDYKFSTFSLGMKQRLAIASALLCDPEILVLDEPTNGLDPQGIVEIRDLIKEVANKGKTIIIASHLLDEVQKVCTHFSVLNKGKLLYSGSVEDLNKTEKEIELRATNKNDLINILKENRIWFDEENNDIIVIKTESKLDDIAKMLSSNSIIITHMQERKSSLEQKFLEILNDTKN